MSIAGTVKLGNNFISLLKNEKKILESTKDIITEKITSGSLN